MRVCKHDRAILFRNCELFVEVIEQDRKEDDKGDEEMEDTGDEDEEMEDAL